MNLHRVKEIRLLSDIGEINSLLATGQWKLAHEKFTEYGDIEYILHRVK